MDGGRRVLRSLKESFTALLRLPTTLPSMQARRSPALPPALPYGSASVSPVAGRASAAERARRPPLVAFCDFRSPWRRHARDGRVLLRGRLSRLHREWRLRRSRRQRGRVLRHCGARGRLSDFRRHHHRPVALERAGALGRGRRRSAQFAALSRRQRCARPAHASSPRQDRRG